MVLKPQDPFVEWLYSNQAYMVDHVEVDEVAVSVVDGAGDGFTQEFWKRAQAEGYSPRLVNTVTEYAELEKDTGFDFGL